MFENMKKILQILLIAYMCFSMPIFAAMQYISDELEVPVRAGSSDRFKVVKMLKSGTEVTILEHNKSTGYTLVSDGKTKGWVLTRYLMDEPSARNFIQEAKENYQPLKDKLVELEGQLVEAGNETKRLNETIRALQQDRQAQAEELAKIKQVSAQALTIDAENKKLAEQVADLTLRIGTASTLNEELRHQNNVNEWMVGASILFAGFILGLITLRYRQRPRRHYY